MPIAGAEVNEGQAGGGGGASAAGDRSGVATKHIDASGGLAGGGATGAAVSEISTGISSNAAGSAKRSECAGLASAVIVAMDGLGTKVGCPHFGQVTDVPALRWATLSVRWQ
jgi:hypothetical protein